MSKKIEEVTASIKSKLSFEDYTCQKEPKPEGDKVGRSESGKVAMSESGKVANTKSLSSGKKVKRTFFIPEELALKIEKIHLERWIENKRIDKSDIVAQALTNFFMSEKLEIQIF